MSGYTKGAWSLPHLAQQGAECNCAYVLSEGYAGCIAKIGVDNGKPVGEGGNDSPPLAEAIANAHLIAAAPDLLEALKACQLQLLQSGDHHEYAQEALELSYAALAKAEPK